MVLSNELVKEYSKRLLLSRMRVLINNGFYGLLLMHMTLSLDETCKTAATDGKRIYFGTEFLKQLSDSEIDFIMMHEILHVALDHISRGKDLDQHLFNIACDIVINSNILYSNNMDLSKITLKEYGVAMHLAPNGDEGYKYTAEEVYQMLIKDADKQDKKSAKSNDNKSSNSNNKANNNSSSGNNSKQNNTSSSTNENIIDDHSRWSDAEISDFDKESWIKKVADAACAISIQNASNNRGIVPLFAERLLKELKNPQTNWLTILNDFIQEEICDYSFSPPDYRYDDSPFYLPSFNDTENVISNVLFMIDTSASMSDKMVHQAYSEIKGAIDQFNGKLIGYLGFFDAQVVEPIKFTSEDEFKLIKAYGGGGTSFKVIFEYVKEFMSDDLPTCIIILTDGYAPFPNIEDTCNIPVLWIINNDKVTPPWGKLSRIKIE